MGSWTLQGIGVSYHLWINWVMSLNSDGALQGMQSLLKMSVRCFHSLSLPLRLTLSTHCLLVHLAIVWPSTVH